MKRLIAIFFLLFPGLMTAQMSFDPLDTKSYSHIVSKMPAFAADIPLDKKWTVDYPTGFATAVEENTDAVKVYPDNAVAHISITSKNFAPIFIITKGFRGVSLTWATDRIIVINRNIGHIASIEEIFDVVDRRWLSRYQIHYDWP